MSVRRFLIYVSCNVTIFVCGDCRVQKVDLALRYLMRKVYRRCCIVEMVYEFFKTVCISFPDHKIKKYVVNKPYPVQYVLIAVRSCCFNKYIYIYIYISNTNEDKTHFKDHLYFDRLVGLLQGE